MMSQQKIEVIIVGDDGIMIQDLTGMLNAEIIKPKLRMPTLEEVTKVVDSCQHSIKKLKNLKETEELLEMMYQENCKNYGEENVRKGDGCLFVTDKGKEHKIWVESV